MDIQQETRVCNRFMQQFSNSNSITWPRQASVGAQYALRSYASELSDLDIDFKSQLQPELAIRVVANCLRIDDQPVGQDEVWSWTLQKRLQALLAITMLTHGRELLLHIRCLQQDCGEDVELPLDLERFSQQIDSDEFTFDIDSRRITARLPNGLDQQQWLQSAVDSDFDMARQLIMRVEGEQLDDDWQFPESWLSSFENALERHDKLMTLEVNSNCPVCEHELKCEIDLEEQLLASLSLVQRQLLLEVHQLALVYHWSETEILKLTPKRRKFYLARIRDLNNGASLQ
jgi:hypothetical protein